MKRALAVPLLLVALAPALGLAACGDDDDAGTTATPTTTATGAATANGATRGSGASDGANANAGPDGAPAGQGRPDGGGDRPVDLTTDPGSIRGARVTATGAVQTLPPSPAAQQTAQRNTYGSIKRFGAEASGEEATNITFALVQYLDAKARGDWATACARLYSIVREGVERQSRSGNCAEAFGTLMSRVPAAARAEQAHIDISSVRRGEGNRAFVIYKTPDTLSADMPLYVEGGVWKVAAIEAYALRPEQVG